MNRLLLRTFKYYWTFPAAPFARMRRSHDSDNRILITRFDGLGDFFILVPFLQELINKNFRIVLVGPSSNKSIVDHLALNVEYLVFDKSEIIQILKKIKTFSFSYAMNLSMNQWGGIIVNQSRSKKKIGLLQEREHYIYKGSKFFYDRIFSYPQATHNFEVLNRLFNDIGIKLFVKQIINTNVTNGTSVIIHPYGNWAPRRWPYFPELIKNLLGKGYQLNVVGTEKEHCENKWINEFSNKSNCVITSLKSISHLLAVIEQCRAFIGNDSGPAHYASLIGKATTVVWGPGYYERIRPLGENVNVCMIPAKCRPCRQKGENCQNGKPDCLIGISPEMVMEQFEKTLIYKL
jgi:ADP-heptose:LPS heptosyltransferase